MTKNFEKINDSLIKRQRSEKNFKLFGLIGIILTSIIIEGKKAFVSTYIKLDVFFDSKIIDPDNTKEDSVIKSANFNEIITKSILENFPEVTDRKEKIKLSTFISSSAEDELIKLIMLDKALIDQKKELWLLASSTIDVIHKNPEMLNFPEDERLIDDKESKWFQWFLSEEKIKFSTNKNFFSNADSTEPEQAGIWGAFVGSFLTLFVTLILSFPIAVAAGVFLEELAPKNKFTDFIEVNINNLAAVPSIIFGLLGLAIFLNVMHLPRSAPIVGGMVLALMTLPTIIIATRASLRAVPPSIREAAIGLGATKFQTVTHHVLPLSMPGISTGTIIGMSQALGESAPLLMIGMVAFIVDSPGSIFDSATVLPVQIYLWKSTAARGFVELTAAGVMVLLSFLVLMNTIAVYIRYKFEKKW